MVCPWKDIPSGQGQILSLIVQATGKSSKENHRIYRDFSALMDNIYVGIKPNPILAENLAITFSYRDLFSAAKVRANSSRRWFWQRFWQSWHFWTIKITNLMYWLFMKLRVKIADRDFAKLKQNVAADADYIKFDDTLRMVVAADSKQIERLKIYLESQYRQGKLVYGLQISNSALMTCLVSEKYGRHVGFIDGADGGYALAAKEMKERIRLRAAKKAISDSVSSDRPKAIGLQ